MTQQILSPFEQNTRRVENLLRIITQRIAVGEGGTVRPLVGEYLYLGGNRHKLPSEVWG